ncbi:MAG: ABC transporter permease [Saprospiraceae bacterium]
MRVLKALLIKEFRQIRRNRILVVLIVMLPVIQLTILPLAADYEMKNIKLGVIDHDHSSTSERLVQKILSSGYFVLSGVGDSYRQGLPMIEEEKVDILLEIPSQFEKNIHRSNSETLAVYANAINSVKASVGSVYISQILSQYNVELIQNLYPKSASMSAGIIKTNSRYVFNDYLRYPPFMVPGILVLLVTMIGGYMSSLNVVKEKEVGTIEQINVSPIQKYQFILGKLIPFWVIGIVIFTIGLFVVGRGIYGVVPLGSYLVIYTFLMIYLVAILGFGLFISSFADTQQQSMSITFFFMMIFILMSGLFTPIQSMPEWAQWIARCNPVTYFIKVMRMVVLKGSTFGDVGIYYLIMVAFAIVLNTLAVINYRKTIG